MARGGGKHWDRWEKRLRGVLAEDPYRRSAGAPEEDARLDLNVVARQVVAEVLLDRHWSQTRAAKALGITQRSVGRFLKGEEGITLASLGGVIEGLDSDVLKFFRSHAEVGGERAKRLRAVRSAVLDAFRVALSPAERRELVELVQEAKDLGVYDRAAAAFGAAVSIARDASKSAKLRKK